MWGAAPYKRNSFALLALALIAIVVSTASDRARAAADTAPPSTPTNLAEYASTTNSITVTWSASADTVGVAGYGIYLNQPGAYKPGPLAGSTTLTRYTLTGLPCGSNYKISVDAYDAAGNRSAKAAITAGTSACPAPATDSTPPSTPAGLAKSGSTGSSITVAWSPSTDNAGVSGYGIYLNQSSAYKPGALVGSTSSTGYSLTGLQCGSTYRISVDAYDAAGNRSSKATIAASTNGCSAPTGDSIPPSTPSGLVKTGSTGTSITVAWRASTDNVGVAGYGVYMSNASALSIGPLVSSTSSTTRTLSGLSCGATYKISVDAYDAAGNRSGKTTITAATNACASATDTTPPSVPDNQIEAGSTQTTIVMAWSPSTDNVGVAGYRVYLNGALIGTTTQTSYTYTGLRCGTTYTVALTAFDAAGNTSNPAFATGPMSTSTCLSASDTQAPSAPASLIASGATTSAITVGWSAASDNVAVVGYDLYVNGTKIGQTAGLSYGFVGLTCGAVYTLSVDAFDAAGNRSPQASLSTSTAPCPTEDNQAPTTPTGLVVSSATQLSITVQWSASSDNVGVAGYGVYTNGVLAGTTPSLSYTLSGLACGTTYVLAVEAYDAEGNRSSQRTLTSSTSPCADTQAPSAPTGLTASGNTQTTVVLAWTASTDNFGVTGYGVYKNGTLAGNASISSYTVSGLTCGTSYAFSVDAYDAAGNHSAKALLSASTAACTSPPPPSGNASVFMSPNGSDSNACTQGAPCQSVQRAYNVAKATGGTVSMAGGTYSNVSLSGTTSSNLVVFQPAAGANVTFSSEFRPNGADNVEIDNVRLAGGVYLNGASDSDPASNIIFRNDSLLALFVRNVHGFQMIGGDVGGTNNGNENTIGAGSTTSRTQDVVLDGVHFHDVTRDTNPTAHTSCLFIQGVSRMTIRNSHFGPNCAIFDIYLHGINGEANPDHVTFDDDVFDSTPASGVNLGYYTVLFRADSGEKIDNFHVSNTTFNGQRLYMENFAGSTVTGFSYCNNSGMAWNSESALSLSPC